MKTKKKELAATLSEMIQEKLIDSTERAAKLKKVIKKMAKGLAERIVKLTVKEEKKRNKAKKSADAVSDVKKNSRKQKKDARSNKLDEIVTSERDFLSTEKDSKDVGKIRKAVRNK